MGVMTSMAEDQKNGTGGSQTLLRGLDVIEACADGPIQLAALADKLGVTVGTVTRASEVAQVIAAGARFALSPGATGSRKVNSSASSSTSFC